jgi:hypothetical protein
VVFSTGPPIRSAVRGWPSEKKSFAVASFVLVTVGVCSITFLALPVCIFYVLCAIIIIHYYHHYYYHHHLSSSSSSSLSSLSFLSLNSSVGESYRSPLSLAMDVQARTEGPTRCLSNGWGMWYTFLAPPLPGTRLVSPDWAVCVWNPCVVFVRHRLPFRQSRSLPTGALVQMQVSLRTGSP